MDRATRDEVKAAVARHGGVGGPDRGGWWAAAHQMALDIEAAEAAEAQQRLLGGNAAAARSGMEAQASRAGHDHSFWIFARRQRAFGKDLLGAGEKQGGWKQKKRRRR